MKKYLLYFIILFSSCISTYRFNKIATQKYSRSISDSVIIGNSYISFKTEKFSQHNDLVKSVTVKSQFYPLIIYWQYDKTIRCELNALSQADKIASYFIYHAETSPLEEKLNGQQIEIIVEEIPNTFVYTNNGHLLFLFSYYWTKEIEAIFPTKQNLRLSYTVYNRNEKTKSGRIDFPTEDKPLKNVLHSTKLFTESYLSMHETLLDELSEDALEKILSEL